MMLEVALVLSLIAGAPSWQTLTNSNYINDILAVDSMLVLATKGGVVLLDPAELQVECVFVNTDGLPANDCLAAAADGVGNIWFGTDGGGLAVVPRQSFSARVYLANLQVELPEKISALTWDGDRLLVGTDRGLYVVLVRGTPLDFTDDAISYYSTATHPELLSDRVLSLAVQDGYWIGTNQGVTSVDRDFTEWTGFRSPLGDSVKSIAFWYDSLVVATERGVAIHQSGAFRPVLTFPQPRGVHDLIVSAPYAYLATDAGVYRGDGMSPDRFSLVLEADARALGAGDTLWVGLGGNELTGDGLAYSTDGSSWFRYQTPGIASNQVSSSAFNPVTGVLHVCHYLTGWGFRSVTELTADGGTAVRESPLINPIDVSCDSRGCVWYAHFASDGGLSVYDPGADTWGTVQWGPWSGWNVIDALGIDASDTKWVYNGQGVVVAIDSLGRQVVFDIPGLAPPPRGGFDFAFDSKGIAWLGLTVGLVMIDTKGTLEDQTDDRYSVITNGLPSSEVRSVAVDAEDNVWLATPQGGAVWNGSSVRTYTVGNSGILDNSVYRVRADPSGRIWFLCQGGVSVLDRVSGSWTNYTPQYRGLIKSTEGLTDFYTSLGVATERGIVAVGTQRGLSLLNVTPVPDTGIDSGIRVYPNPCILGENERIRIAGLPEQARVEIRTLTGALVARLAVNQGRREAVWRPGDVATGIYLVSVFGTKGIRVERVAVIGR